MIPRRMFQSCCKRNSSHGDVCAFLYRPTAPHRRIQFISIQRNFHTVLLVVAAASANERASQAANLPFGLFPYHYPTSWLYVIRSVSVTLLLTRGDDGEEEILERNWIPFQNLQLVNE